MTENMSMQHPEPTGRASLTQRRGTMICIICKAVYAPSQWNKNLWRAPSAALESAFISMCHFCYRCRRLSCPNCWDGVHRVCGACVQDANLSFRLEASPLSGAPSISSQIQSAQIQPIVQTPLVCIRPGRLPGTTPSIDLLPTRPERVPKKNTRRQREASKAAKQRSLLPSSPPLVTHQAVGKHRRSGRSNRQIRHLLILFFLLVFAIIFLIVVNKNVSSNVNIFIAKVLPADIRVRIAYLWRLIGHIY